MTAPVIVELALVRSVALTTGEDKTFVEPL
jgi:hypothetical protein